MTGKSKGPDHAEVQRRLTAAETALGVTFRDRELLRTALTHPSYALENDSPAEYERLEFLGDSVLGFAVAEYVFNEFPDMPEGTLSRLRSEVVSGQYLAEAAERAGIDAAILLGRGTSAEGGRRLASVREDVVEALIGAVYLDQGMEAAKAVVARVVLSGSVMDVLGDPTRNPKGVLQEAMMAEGRGLPDYRVIGQEGPPHDRRFTVEVSVDGVVAGTGCGPSKQSAEKAAAVEAIHAFGLV